MSDEPNNTQQEPGQEPQEPAQGAAQPEEKTRDWEKLARESFLREKKLNERLAAIEKSQADAKEAEERKQLEAKGEYEKIVEQLKAQNESTVKAHEAELLRMKLDAALMKEGAQNEVFIRGAIASFTGTDEEIAQYVSELKANEANAVFFGEAKPTGQKPLAHGAPGSRSNSKTLDERIADGDIDAMNEKLRSMI